MGLARLEGTGATAHGVMGANQKDRLPFSHVQHFQKYSHLVRLLAVSSVGKNALDFHIAYLLGQLTAADAGAQFFIVSQDTGFDPLVQYLRREGLAVARAGSFARLPFLQDSAALPADHQVELAESKLKRIPVSQRPRKTRTLKSWIAALFGKQLSEAEVARIVEGLVERKVFSVSNKATLLYGP